MFVLAHNALLLKYKNIFVCQMIFFFFLLINKYILYCFGFVVSFSIGYSAIFPFFLTSLTSTHETSSSKSFCVPPSQKP